MRIHNPWWNTRKRCLQHCPALKKYVCMACLGGGRVRDSPWTPRPDPWGSPAGTTSVCRSGPPRRWRISAPPPFLLDKNCTARTTTHQRFIHVILIRIRIKLFQQNLDQEPDCVVQNEAYLRKVPEIILFDLLQCSGSVTFWYACGSGSSDPYL